MGQPSIYHATVSLSFQIEICNLDRTKSSFLATSLYKKVIFTKNLVTRSCRPSDDMLRRQLLRHWYLSEDRVRLMGMIGFLVQGRVRIRIRVRVRDRVRVYVSFNISISCRSICRRSICHGTILSYTCSVIINQQIWADLIPILSYAIIIILHYT